MRARMAALWLVALAAALLAAPAAQAAFGVDEFEVEFANQDGSAVEQAGSHPFSMTTSVHFNSHPSGEGGEELEEAAKDILTVQAPGFVGDPAAVPTCSTADFLRPFTNSGGADVPDCPDASALGFAAARLAGAKGQTEKFGAVYNLVPPPGVVARLGFWIVGAPVTIELGAGESFPYNVVGGPTNISQLIEVTGAKLTLWGVPADPVHDPLRGHCLKVNEGGSLGSCPSGLSPRPFLTMPRACTGPLLTGYEADSWLHPGDFVSGTAESGPMRGCGRLGFAPEVAADPSTASAESSSGLDFELDVADENLRNASYEAVADADIEKLTATLPAGVTANPSAAEGLGYCTLGQYQAEALATPAGLGCPDAAKLGTIEAQTPVLENHTLRGSVYLAQPDEPAAPGAENPFNSFLALYIVIRDPERGIFIKLAAKIEPDPKRGQLITTVEELPPFPISHVGMHLRSGARAPLVTPPACGTYTTQTLLTPTSGAAPLRRDSTFTIDSGPGGGPCPLAGPAFAPALSAGAQSNAAGHYSPFTMRITRRDGEQDITRFSATLPPGEVAKIAGVPTCQDAAIAAAKGRSGKAELASPSCPAASQIGTVLAGAGVGSALTYVPGSLYLAGPYKGAQLSVAAIVPAVAGPFDVGTVVTRVGLTLIPESGEAEVDGAASDPIPHILKGIPLKLRDLRIYVDRPGFTLNPTSCNVFSTRAQLAGSGADPFLDSDDTLAAAAARYQASSCASLRFKPGLKIQLKGQTKRSGFPKLHSVVTYPQGSGYANIGRAVVTLPHSAFISPLRVANPCTRPAFAEGKCPPASRLGYAKAWTPLLDEPLQGPVYFRSNGGVRDIPDIVADLNGQFHVILVGAVDSVGPTNKARLRTTFAQVPDAPVSRFVLDLKGGKEGVIENSQNLCAGKRYVKVKLRGQNGQLREFQTLQQVKCPKKGKAAKRRARP